VVNHWIFQTLYIEQEIHQLLLTWEQHIISNLLLVELVYLERGEGIVCTYYC